MGFCAVVFASPGNALHLQPALMQEQGLGLVQVVSVRVANRSTSSKKKVLHSLESLPIFSGTFFSTVATTFYSRLNFFPFIFVLHPVIASRKGDRRKRVVGNTGDGGREGGHGREGGEGKK